MIDKIFTPDIYYTVIYVMIGLAVVVYVALHKVTAGYGMMRTSGWGPTLGNRIGWVLMESPVFFAMLYLWLASPRSGEPALVVMVSLFLYHYFQRSFIFPLLIRGKSRIPYSIVGMGVLFNLVNAYLIGGWLFYVSPAAAYPVSWLWNPLFIAGVCVFFVGNIINLYSDNIIRHLRRPGDMRHYIPRGGMYRYVTSANYFGELLEWTGYAILTWSLPACVFVLWTFANLAPRARSLHKRYVNEFGDEYTNLRRRYLIPFIY